jgi:large subunit ribosomal protein L24
LQTTLLGIAIALILAVVAALIAPFVIDWSAYRPILEAEASRVLGTQVSVAGAIDARLLPSPRLNLHDVTIGSGAERMHADELDLQFALTPLLRGAWQAEEMRLASPQFTLRLDKNGRVQAPAFAANFDPETLSIDRLQIEAGTLMLAGMDRDATVTLSGVFFNGRARSLLGPYDGSGAFTVGGESYSLENLSTGRINDGALRVRAVAQPADHPYRVETEGTLHFADAKPRFEGALALTPTPGLKRKAATWSVHGKLTANASSAQLQNLELAYGGEKPGMKLTGLVRFDYAKAPSLSAELNAARVDLDAMLANPDGSHPAPAATLRDLAKSTGVLALLPSISTKAGVKIDEVVLGGASLLEVAGDLRSTHDGWELKPLQFRAPGFSKVMVSGSLKANDGALAFSGPVEIEAADPKALFAWLEGRGRIASSDARPLTLQGDVALGAERLAIVNIKARFDGEPLTGRVAYTFAAAKRGAQLDAALSADRLDLDTAIAFGKAIAAGSQMQTPDAISLRGDIARASFGGFSGRDASADISYDNKRLTIRKLTIADLGGARLDVSGDLDLVNAAKQSGKLQADLAAPELKPVLAVLARVAPTAAAALQPSENAPAKLHSELSLRAGSPLGHADLKLNGTLGAAEISLDANAAADLMAGNIGEVHVDSRIATADGRMLLPLLRLERAIEVAEGPGTLTLKANGRYSGPLNVSAQIAANGLNANIGGTATLTGKRHADLKIAVRQANAAPLQGVSGIGPLPVSYTSAVTLRDDKLMLDGIKADIGTAKLNGKLTLGLQQPLRVGGALAVDTSVDAPKLLAAAAGARLASERGGKWTWTSDPFLPVLGAAEGDVTLTANRIALAPAIEARRFKSTLHFGPHEIAAQNIEADVSGGRLKGQFALSDSNGLTVQGQLTLVGADAAALTGAGARPPLTGTLGVEMSFGGSGLSPAALVGSLRGRGKVVLSEAQLSGLAPRAFDIVTRAVDTGVPIEPSRIADVVSKALASGGLRVKQAEGALALNAGQLRLERVRATSEDAQVDASGTLDLTDGMLESRLVLSGEGTAGGMRPDIYMALSGPLADPQRSVDVSALTGWLTLRSVELQARKVKALEEADAKRRAEEEAATKRRADDEAKRRAFEEAKRQAEDEARLRVMLGTPGGIAAPPVGPADAVSRPASARPANAAVTTQSSRTGKVTPAPGLVPLIESAPALPPPIAIERAPGMPVTR